jgi:hypothetical protein
MNQMVGKALRNKAKTQQSHIKTINGSAKRAASASAGHRRKPPPGKPNFFQQN